MGKKNFSKEKEFDKRNKGGKGKGRGYSKHSSADRSSDVTSKDLNSAMDGRASLDAIKSNDIGWYNRSPLFPLATRIPWNQVMGANTEPELLTGANRYPYTASVPGLMTIDFAPTIGWAADMNSAVNRAFNQLYSDIVSRTTGALQMQQMDLAIMAIGVSSIACHLGYAKKALGAYQNYASLNYYMPRPLIASLGFDFDDMVENAPNYQIELTDLINRFNRLAIPNFSDVHVRQYALSHNMYADSETVFGQIINFRPYTIYYFNDAEHSLEAHEIWSVAEDWDVITFSTYMAYIRNALSRWENSSVTPIVAGNVRRAYPESALVVIEQYNPTDKVIPVVDTNITYQVNNMRWNTVKLESLNITQDPVANVLLCQPKWLVDSPEEFQALDRNYHTLNSFDGVTDETFVMEASRLIPVINFKGAVPQNGEIDLVGCPSELVTRVTVFTNMRSGEGATYLAPQVMRTSDFIISDVMSFTDVAAYVLYSTALTKWRNGPGIITHFYNENDDVFVGTRPADSREFNLFTHLHQDQLDVLHLAASQSLFWANGFKVGK